MGPVDPSEPPRSRRLGRPPPPLGRLGETLAAAHLEGLGFAILARNVRTRHGEIDLVAFDGETLVFAEVKTARRRGDADQQAQRGDPLQWLGPPQRARLRRLASAWLCDAGGTPPARPCDPFRRNRGARRPSGRASSPRPSRGRMVRARFTA